MFSPPEALKRSAAQPPPPSRPHILLLHLNRICYVAGIFLGQKKRKKPTRDCGVFWSELWLKFKMSRYSAKLLKRTLRGDSYNGLMMEHTDHSVLHLSYWSALSLCSIVWCLISILLLKNLFFLEVDDFLRLDYISPTIQVTLTMLHILILTIHSANLFYIVVLKHKDMFSLENSLLYITSKVGYGQILLDLTKRDD